MRGLRFDFENSDLYLLPDGTFAESVIDSQNCALIAISQVCRITKPEVGTQLTAKLINRKTVNTASALAEARRAVEKDGGTNVLISVDSKDKLNFEATYED